MSQAKRPSGNAWKLTDALRGRQGNRDGGNGREAAEMPHAHHALRLPTGRAQLSVHTRAWLVQNPRVHLEVSRAVLSGTHSQVAATSQRWENTEAARQGTARPIPRPVYNEDAYETKSPPAGSQASRTTINPHAWGSVSHSVERRITPGGTRTHC